MRSDAVGGLTIRKINGHGEHALWLDLEVERVGDGERTVGNADAWATGERYLLQRGRLDLVDAGAAIDWEGDCDFRDGEVCQAKGIGYPEAKLRGAYRHVECLPDCGVDEDGARLVEGHRGKVSGLSELRHRCPGVDPVAIGRVGSYGASGDITIR